jgi:hypothetical protein
MDSKTQRKNTRSKISNSFSLDISCAVREFMKREWEALERDRYNHNDPAHRTLEQLTEWLDQYPSVLRRFWRLRNTYWEVSRYIKYIPDNIKNTYQRSRQGWGERDLWDFDFYVAEFMETALSQYKIDSLGHPVDLTEQEWNDIINEIIYGFRQYRIWWENVGTLTPEEEVESWNELNRMLERSFYLWGKYFYNLSI